MLFSPFLARPLSLFPQAVSRYFSNDPITLLVQIQRYQGGTITEPTSGGDTDWQARIVSDPEILVGKPVIKGARLVVGVMIDLLAGGVERTGDSWKVYSNLGCLAILASSSSHGSGGIEARALTRRWKSRHSQGSSRSSGQWQNT